MKRSTFLLITAVASFIFGAMMFLNPDFAAELLGIETSAQTIAVLRGMGALIIGNGAMNYFLRHQTNIQFIQGLLLANIITHLLGLSADIWGAVDGALAFNKMAPVEITHFFVITGSLFYYLKLRKN
jgi:hypothetical protein